MASSSWINADEKRARGSVTCEYSQVSAMRPTRSCTLTNWYLAMICWRSVSLGCGITSLISLNTYGYDGSVNTVMTRPLIPGATTNWSLEWRR